MGTCPSDPRYCNVAIVISVASAAEKGDPLSMVSAPVVASMLKTVIEFPPGFAAYRYLPEGSTATVVLQLLKPNGVPAIGAKVPLAEFTVNADIVPLPSLQV